jgi:peptidoglycan/LPS O-acetylase OafA/YrhL
MGVDNLAGASSDSQPHISGLDGIRACAFLLLLVGQSGISWVPNGFGVTVLFFLADT